MLNPEKKGEIKGSSRISLLLRLTGSIVMLGLLVYSIMKLGWEDQLDAINQIGTKQLVTSLIYILLSRLAISLRWFLILRSADRGIPFIETVKVTFVGLFSSNFLPTSVGGDFIRLASVKRFGIDSSKYAGSIIVDRLVGFSGMILMVPFGLAPVLNLDEGRTLGQLSLIALFARSEKLTAIYTKLRNWMIRLVKSIGFWIRKPKRLILPFLANVLHMIFLFSAVFSLLAGMGSSLSILLVGGLWSFVYIVTLLPISLNGIGLQELSISYIFSNVGGVPIAHSVAMALVIRLLMMIASIPGAFLIKFPRDE